jgi:hypothetical protein
VYKATLTRRSEVDIQTIIGQIDAEIAKLQKVRSVLAGGTGPVKEAKAPKKLGKRRGLSAEGRAKIAAAQKARWAKLKKAKNAGK